MMAFIWPGAMAAQVIYVAAKLKIADLLKDRPGTLEELARETGSRERPLRRFLRALVDLGVVTEDASGRFHSTVLCETLRSDRPNSMRPWAMMLGAPFVWRSWGELAEAVATGEPSFERIFGTSLFEHLATHPEDSATFDAAMTSSSATFAAIVEAYDFSRFDRIVDVGGGQGGLLRQILEANPRSRGVLYDSPTVVSGAKALQGEPFASRCEILGGDFFTSVPRDGDAYVLKQIIHSWNDDDAVRILRNCRKAIRSDGTLLIIGDVVQRSIEPNPNQGLMDMMMLVLSPGQERTREEYAALLRKAGFFLVRVVPTRGPSILESRPL